jgi:hypothetical protein
MIFYYTKTCPPDLDKLSHHAKIRVAVFVFYMYGYAAIDL